MKVRCFHKAFLDTAYSLMNEFKDDQSNTLIILGANALVHFKYNYDEVIKRFDKVIIYNQENYYGAKKLPWFEGYLNIVKQCDEVWDYCESNIPLFKQHGIESKLHILKPYMNWDLYASVPKDIDILVYGLMTPRRKNLIDFLNRKYNVVTLDNVFGSELDDYILRSKILLNIHSSEGLEQEHARMVKWIGAPCRIVSEKSPINYLNIPEMEYWELFCL